MLRDSDIEVEDEAEDLVRYFRSAIKRRRRGRVDPALKFPPRTPPELEELVREGTGRRYRTGVRKRRASSASPTSAQLVEIDQPDLKFPPYSPRFPSESRARRQIEPNERPAIAAAESRVAFGYL